MKKADAIETEAAVVPHQNGALAVRESMPAPAREVTPTQAKVEAIASLTMAAYARASTLQLTPEEQAKLAADFPDEAFKPGAAGKEHLIYIEHAFLRDRFNSTFGPGQWSIIPRNRWTEPFSTKGGTEGQRVYVEAMFMIRGCFVAEAVGAMEYYPSNAGQDYSDAVEGAKTAALRRCAKELGVGLQAWKKDFGDGWWQRRKGAAPNSNTRNFRSSGGDSSPASTRMGGPGAAGSAGAANSSADGSNGHNVAPSSSSAARTSPQANPVAGKEKTVTPAKPAKAATAVTRGWFLGELAAATGQPNEAHVRGYLEAIGWLLPTEATDTLELRFVATDKRQLNLFEAGLKDFIDSGEAQKPYAPNPEAEDLGASGPKTRAPASARVQGEGQPAKSEPRTAPARPVSVPRDEQSDPNAPDAPWRSAPIPYGKQKDKPLGGLGPQEIFGWWANFEVTTEYNGRPKKAETVAKERAFRAALDAAGQHYEFREIFGA